MGSLRGNRGRSRADPLRILALSCLFALHNIETTLRSVVPPAAGLHTYTWCTTSAQNPLSLSPSLFSSLSPSISASLPPFYSFFPARPLRLRSTHELRAFCPVCLFLLLPLFLLSPEEKGTGGWIEGAHKAAKRAGGGRQQQVLADKQETGRVASQDLRFTFIRFSFFLLAAGSGANQNTLDSDAPSIIPGKDESWKRIGEM